MYFRAGKAYPTTLKNLVSSPVAADSPWTSDNFLSSETLRAEKYSSEVQKSLILLTISITFSDILAVKKGMSFDGE